MSNLTSNKSSGLSAMLTKQNVPSETGYLLNQDNGNLLLEDGNRLELAESQVTSSAALVSLKTPAAQATLQKNGI